MAEHPLLSSLAALTLLLLALYPTPASSQQDLLYEFRPQLEQVRGIPFTAPTDSRIGVVLSGGGSRGMAHIGTLRALEEAGLKPSFIAGVSAGAVIGGLYAAGYTPDELEELAAGIAWQDLFTDTPERTNLFLPQKEERATYALQVRFEGWQPVLPTSYMTGQRIGALFSDLTFKGDFWAAGDFDRLSIPFRAVSTDLLKGERVVISDGTLAEALMASTAIPVVLSAKRRGNQLLVDGGLVDAIPVGVVRDMGAELIVASDVSAALRDSSHLGSPIEVLDQVMSIMMRRPNAQSLAEADLVISPALGDHYSSDFAGVDTLVTVGYETARAAIAQWESNPESRHLIRLAGVHPEHGPALRVISVDVEGGSESQQERVFSFIERELIGRSADPVGLEATAVRLMDDGSLSNAVLRVYSAPRPATGTEIPVTLSIEITSRPLVTEIRFEGANLYDPPELRRVISSRAGEPVDRIAVASDIRTLEQYHQDRGYPLVLIRETRFTERSGILTFVLDEGRVDEIRIEGLVQTNEELILRDLPLTVGQPFGQHSIRQMIDDIYSTGLFERVTIRPERTGRDGLSIVVTVEERPPDAARIGIHYLEEQKTEGFLEYRNENLLGRGGKMSIRALTGSRRSSLDMQTRIDRLFRTFLSWQLNAGYGLEEINTFQGEELTGAYQTERYHIAAAIGHQVRRLGLLSIGFRAENLGTERVSGLTSYDATHQFREVELRSVIDTQDRTPFPTEGVRHEFSYVTASDAHTVESISHVRLFLAMESYHTRGRHTFHPRFVFGTGDHTMPFARWYRLGGIDSFYGYSRDQLRGRQVLLLSGEYRYRIPWQPVAPLHLSLRFDWGGSWEEIDNTAFTDMISGLGIKASLDSPLGPLEVAWGMREGGYSRVYVALGFRF
ncbi:patatin-like phospholipase family protein [Candidatus Zixiibacteriota bacterium]